MVKTIDANGRNITKANRGWVTDNAELFQALDPSIDIGALTGAAKDSKAPVKRARGGYIPGNPSTGDSVKALLTPGEVVLNRDQQAKVGHNTIKSAINGGAPKNDRDGHQQFAGGGMAQDKSSNAASQNISTAGLKPAALAELANANRFGLHLISGFRQDKFPEHPSGLAMDLSNGLLTSEMQAYASSLQSRGRGGSPIHGVIYNNQSTGYGGKWDWKTYGGGNTGNPTQDHKDHVHVWMLGNGDVDEVSPGAGATGSGPAKLSNMTKAPNFGKSVMGRATQSAAGRLRASINGKVAARNNGGGILNALGGAMPGGPRGIAKAMLGQFGWGEDQWPALNELWDHESKWNPTIANSSSGAYGIPQALPGSKMANVGQGGGPDWRTNPETQIRWGMNYIKNRPDYGSPAKALEMWKSRSPHWYGNGGSFRTKKPHLIGVGEKGPEDVTITPARGRKGGGGGGGRGATINSNIHVGTLIADDAGIELLAQKVGGVMVNDLRRARGTTARDEG
jgi:hypothetical protein